MINFVSLLLKPSSIFIIALLALSGYLFFMIQVKERTILQKELEITKSKQEIALLETAIEKQKTLIGQCDFDKGQLNFEIQILNDNNGILKNTVEGFQTRIDELLKDSDYWYWKAKERENLLKTLTETDLQNLKGKIIDETSSTNTIMYINNLIKSK
jgi:hypothetical protein